MLYNAYQNVIILKHNKFSALIVSFLNKQSESFYNWKNYEKLMKSIFRTKRTLSPHPFKRCLLKNWWVENMPVVAGGLVKVLAVLKLINKL